MDFPKSVPGVGLVNGKFIDEDPLAATPGSLIPSAWGNAVTQELLKVIEDAGLVPAEEDNTQLSQAIEKLVGDVAIGFATKEEAEAGTESNKAMSPVRVFQAIAKKITQATEGTFGWLKIGTQVIVNAGEDDTAAVTAKKLASAIRGQSVVYFRTTGTSTAQVLTPTPALSGYVEGQRFSVVFNVASGLNPNIKVSGLNGKFLKQYDTTGAKVQAVWAAGQISDIVYDGTDFIVLDVGASVPAATTAIPGIARFGTPTEQTAGLLANVMANPQGVMALVTAMFPKRTFTANDFVRIPDVPGGLIIQWGRVEDNGATNTFPTPFGTQGLSITATIDADAFQGGSVTAFIASNSQFRIREAGSVTAGVFMRYIAIGF